MSRKRVRIFYLHLIFVLCNFGIQIIYVCTCPSLLLVVNHVREVYDTIFLRQLHPLQLVEVVWVARKALQLVAVMAKKNGMKKKSPGSAYKQKQSPNRRLHQELLVCSKCYHKQIINAQR